jgi:hypothetical protein
MDAGTQVEFLRMAKQLKIVRLLEPEMCLECRFAQMADVESDGGGSQKMIYCRRLDCDNWDTSGAQPAKRMRVDTSYDDFS